jgi:tricorn protease
LLDGIDQIVSDDGMYGLNSQWVVENIGVSPDVTVHDEPGQLNRGYDAQLETAVRMLMEETHKAPRHLPPPPAWIPAFPPQPAYPKCTHSMNPTTCG